jgi:hypothetical protein
MSTICFLYVSLASWPGEPLLMKGSYFLTLFDLEENIAAGNY